MCEVCERQARGDTFEQAIEHFQDQTEATIAKHGHSVIGVFDPDGEQPPFVYTAGLTGQGRPELFMSGLSINTAATLLNDIARGDQPFEAGDLMNDVITGGYVLAVIEIPDPLAAQMTTAVDYYHRRGQEIRAVQIVWPDEDHRYPWDDGYDPQFVQPLHGPAPKK